MKQLIPMDEHGMFADYNDTALVDSRFVADAFEKGHREVLRSIDQILSDDSGYSAEFNRCNFAPISYTDVRGRKQRCYAMTRDGFTALVMGFTGKKAARFKEFYIKRFNEMERFIGALVSAREQFPKLTAQIRLLHPNAKPYHYSNECDMLNRIVIGKHTAWKRDRASDLTSATTRLPCLTFYKPSTSVCCWPSRIISSASAIWNGTP